MIPKSRHQSSHLARHVAASLVVLAVASCIGFDPAHPPRAPLADKWFSRAKVSYRAGDFDDASESIKSALQASPSDQEIRILGARVALSRLEFADALRLTEGLQTSDVHSIRGRARWYSGDIDQAADELEAMLQDPLVKDPWAREVAKLARRGTGRHPFAMEGGLVAAVEMPKAGPMAIVPCELEGESILALVSTATGELIVDSASRREPAWVNLSFGNVEVKDVPALVEDLTGLSHQIGAPIKALLGVNLLRHMHVTFDRKGDQFVVRHNEPTPPPDASRVPLWYVRGGGMLMHVSVTQQGTDHAPLLVDSSALFPISLGDAEWKLAGVDPNVLEPVPGAPNLKGGTVPQLKLGSFDLPKVPAVEDLPHPEQDLGVDLGGVLGSGLLSIFRITFGDEGRFMWIEPDPTMMQALNEDAGRVPRAPGPPQPPTGTSPPRTPGATPGATPPTPPPAKAPKS
jgi:hypothetical protein